MVEVIRLGRTGGIQHQCEQHRTELAQIPGYPGQIVRHIGPLERQRRSVSSA
jgi:hypothetical protein